MSYLTENTNTFGRKKITTISIPSDSKTQYAKDSVIRLYKNTFIEIKENEIINNILQKYKNKNYYYLNIKLINKYNNTAVIYLI